METGRCDAPAGLVRATSAAARLANVVRRARLVSTEPLVSSDGDLLVAWQTGSDGAFCAQSVSSESTALCTRDSLSLPFYDGAGTSRNRRLVETSGTWRISAERLARRRAVN